MLQQTRGESPSQAKGNLLSFQFVVSLFGTKGNGIPFVVESPGRVMTADGGFIALTESDEMAKQLADCLTHREQAVKALGQLLFRIGAEDEATRARLLADFAPPGHG